MAVPVAADYEIYAPGTSASVIAPTIPNDWLSGDFVIAFVFSGIRTITSVPSGWGPAIGAVFSDGVNSAVYGKALTSGEPGSSPSWSMSAGTSNRSVVLVRVTGQAATNIINTSTTDGASFTTPVVSPSVTTTVNNCLILRMIMNNQNGLAGTGTGDIGTPLVLDSSALGSLSIFYSSKASAGSTGTASYDRAGAFPPNRGFHLYTIAIAPAASGGPWPFHLDAQSLSGGLQTLGL